MVEKWLSWDMVWLDLILKSKNSGTPKGWPIKKKKKDDLFSMHNQVSLIILFLHLFSKYFLSVFCTPRIILGFCDLLNNSTDMDIDLMEFTY